MHNVKKRNVHGRVGVRRPARPLTEGQRAKRERRLTTNPHHQPKVRPTHRRIRYRGEWTFVPKGQAPFLQRTLLGRDKVIVDEIQRSDLEPVYFNTTEAAVYLDRSPGYVKDHAKEIGGEKHGLRWRFTQDDLDAWKAAEEK